MQNRSSLVLFALASSLTLGFVACGDSGTGIGGSGPGSGGSTSSSSRASSGATGGSGGSSEKGGGSAQGGGAQGGGARGGGAQGGAAANGGGGAGGGSAGLCSGVVCTASDQCHGVGTCDPMTGICSNPALTDGTSCNDMMTCTLGATCKTGVCTAPTGMGSVDQSCLPTSALVDITSTDKPGQSFKAGAAGQLMGVELALAKCTNTLSAAGSIQLDVFNSSNMNIGTATVTAASITHACAAYALRHEHRHPANYFDLSKSCIAVTSGETVHFELSLSRTSKRGRAARPTSAARATSTSQLPGRRGLRHQVRSQRRTRLPDLYANGKRDPEWHRRDVRPGFSRRSFDKTSGPGEVRHSRTSRLSQNRRPSEAGRRATAPVLTGASSGLPIARGEKTPS